CLTILLLNPYQIWDVGFQLSFIVTWGLLVMTAPIAERIPIRWHPLRSAIAVTISAELACAPIIMFYFYQFHFLSPLVNFIFVPFFSVFIIPLGFIGLLLGMIHPAIPYLLAAMITN